MNAEYSALLLSHGILDLVEKEHLNPQLLAQSIRYAIRRRQIDDQIKEAIEHVGQ